MPSEALAQPGETICSLHEEALGPWLYIERPAKSLFQIAQLRRLILVFAGRICQFVDFVVFRRISNFPVPELNKVIWNAI